MLESANTNHTSFSGCNVPGEVGGTAFQNGVSTSFAYEQAINRLHEMSTADPGSGTIQDFSYNHDSNGKIRGANDNVIPSNGQTFTYDFLNRLVASQGAYGPSGQTIGVDTKYDVNGRPWEKSLPYFVGNEAPRYIQYAYDCLGRLTQTSYPDGTYTTAAYSQALTTYTDRNREPEDRTAGPLRKNNASHRIPESGRQLQHDLSVRRAREPAPGNRYIRQYDPHCL